MTGSKWLVTGIAAALLMAGAVTGVSLASGGNASPPSLSSTAAPQTVAPEGGRQQPSKGSFRHGEGFAIGKAIQQLSGKTPEELRALKEGKTWQQVAESLGLNWEQVQAEAKKLVAEQPKERGFKHDGAQMRDRAIVSFLAELTGRTPKDILALKTKDNTWVDVAKQLGVTIAR